MLQLSKIISELLINYFCYYLFYYYFIIFCNISAYVLPFLNWLDLRLGFGLGSELGLRSGLEGRNCFI